METGGGEEDQMVELQSEKCTQEMLRTIFSGMHTLLTAALRQPGLKVEVRDKLKMCWGKENHSGCLVLQIFKDDLQQLK